MEVEDALDDALVGLGGHEHEDHVNGREHQEAGQGTEREFQTLIHRGYS
jgi:hypothetical protein